MGKLRNRMMSDLQLRNYAPSTCKRYVHCAWEFAAYHRRPPEQMGEQEIRQFLIHLTTERTCSPAGRKMYVAALKFLYGTTLRRPKVVEHIPWPKVRSALPDILSGTEVVALLAALETPKCRAIVMTAYGAGLRVSEVCSLCVSDIESRRMLLHIRNAKGGRDRYVPLPERVLFTLRRYWAATRPSGPELFPGDSPGRAISASTVRKQLKKATAKAGISKRVTPHVLRHSFATHLLELGTDVRVIQMLLGHRSIRTTMRYTRVTDKHLERIESPVDVLGTPKAKKLG